jgi:uncharacterized membrane protein required for colicin V production
MNAVDFIIILVLAYGIFRGYKSGGITSFISLISMLLTFVIAYFLKNPLSALMYENLPFVKFGGIFTNISSINILFYEAIAYIICFIIITAIFRVLLKVTHLVDKVIEKLSVTKLLSKILGVIFGFLEYYIYIYVFILLMTVTPVTTEYFNGSFLTKFILNDTPIVSDVTNKLNSTVKEVYEICVEYKGSDSKKEADYKALETMLKYEIITTKSVKKLGDAEKIYVDNYQELVDKYENNISGQVNDKLDDITKTTTTEVKND